MSCKNIKLGDIPIIANSLKCGTTRAVKTINSILGFTEFDRSSRNKIRNFSTFPKEFRVEEHKEKILTEFSLPDFISVANLLHLDVETNEQNLCNSIFKALTNLDEFQLTLNNSEASFSEGENVVSKTTFQKRITLDRNFSSEGTDQHSPFQQHPVSNSPLPSVQGHLSKSCPNHSRGPRCLSCNLYGHKSYECRGANLNNTSTPLSGVNAVHELPSPINMCKDVTIFGRKLNGLVDTGSNLTLLRNSTYINIDAPPLKQTNTLLTGFGFSRINVIGTLDSEIIIDDQIFPVTISVVLNSCTNYDLIIGCDVIKQAHLNISPTGVKFAQILRPSDNANENFIMTISDGSPTFDIGPNVSQHNRAEIEQLLSIYMFKKTKAVNIELDIALTDDEPIFHKPRRLPFAERDLVDAQVDEWVKNGIVEPCSSPYASQVVVVKKKDGKSRVCIDYRRLNRKLIKDNYPLPLIDDILDCLQNAKIFTTPDLKNGFFHVAVNERSRKFTSFVTHNGQYQFRRMPFGLSTCPSTFMRYINAIFRHLISKSIVLPYMDDVVIPAANESQALEYLKIVLQAAWDYGLEINF
ncbi:retrovirus-related Pol polyprotein from transposon 412 [Trichonephila clavipes]|nr:retrovirus-related Pol polyprotein from transposon 412 [Trichonephila clavipes]